MMASCQPSSRFAMARPGLALVLGWLLALTTAADPASGEGAWWSGELDLSLAVDWSHGDYDEPESTDVLHVPLGIRYLFDDFWLTPTRDDYLEVGVTIPYLHVDGPAEFFFERPGVLAARTSAEDGIGDVRVFATWLFAPRVDNLLPAAELSVKVKIPTADETRGLGTGEVDTSLELALSRSFGAFTPFGSLGYRFLGDSDAFSLRSGIFASAGLGWRPHPRLSLGALYAYTRASVATRDDAHELIPYFSWHLRPDLRLEPYVSVRLAGYAPDVGAGVRFRWFVPNRP